MDLDRWRGVLCRAGWWRFRAKHLSRRWKRNLKNVDGSVCVWMCVICLDWPWLMRFVGRGILWPVVGAVRACLPDMLDRRDTSSRFWSRLKGICNKKVGVCVGALSYMHTHANKCSTFGLVLLWHHWKIIFGKISTLLFSTSSSMFIFSTLGFGWSTFKFYGSHLQRVYRVLQPPPALNPVLPVPTSQRVSINIFIGLYTHTMWIR